MDSFIWSDSDCLKLFIYLIIEANHKDTETMFNGKKLIIKRGSLIIGRKSLDDKLKINEYKIYRLLKTLESEHLIEQQKTNRYTIVSIVKYTDYQSNEQQSEQPMHNRCTTDAQQMHTVKELRSIKKNEEEGILSSKLDLQAPVLYLNEKAKTNFGVKNKSTAAFIQARYKEGRTLEDFKLVIDKKCAEWLTDEKMFKFLRPSTLFNATNFENYLNEKTEYEGVKKHEWIRD